MKLQSLQTNYLNHYFDHIYVINLQHAVEDRLKVSKHLKEQGLYFEVFEASNGYKGEVYEQYREYNKGKLGNLKRFPEYNEQEISRCFHYISSPGVMGHLHTFLRILRDAKSKKYNRFLILEDDVLFSEDFESKFNSFIQNINDKWKVLLLGASQYGWDTIDTDTASRNGFYHPVSNAENSFTYSTFAIALNLSIVDELIETVSVFESPVDYLPLGEIYEKFRQECYAIYPNIAIQDVASSTLRAAQSQNNEAKKRKWILEDFDYPLDKPSISVIISSKGNLNTYLNFSSAKELPFHLRLFFNSIDGLHPLHNTELLNKIENKIKPLDNNIFLPESDYFVTIDEEETLEESDIVKFIEYKVGILEENLTPLKEITISKKSVKKGRVSVIIPLYQKPKNLKDTLTSVMMQDYHDIEVIVVIEKEIDKTIIEDTKQLISSLNGLNSNCHIVLIKHSINRNLAAVRNTGIMNSSGEYICFLDDNNVYLQSRLSKSISKLMQTNKTMAAVYCGYTDANRMENNSQSYKTGNLTNKIFLHAFKAPYLPINTITYKRTAIVNLNYFNESYQHYQNSEFHLRYFENYTMENVEENLVLLSSDSSIIRTQIEKVSRQEEKRKFLNQFSYLTESIIESQNELLDEQREWIQKLEQLKISIHELLKIRFSRHPIKKIKSYKKLIAFYRKLR